MNIRHTVLNSVWHAIGSFIEMFYFIRINTLQGFVEMLFLCRMQNFAYIKVSKIFRIAGFISVNFDLDTGHNNNFYLTSVCFFKSGDKRIN